MKWALIEDGFVKEVTDTDPEGRFHNSLEWVPCSEVVCAGMIYSCGEFSAQPDDEGSEASNILRRLQEIDMLSVRPLRAIAAGSQSEEDVDRLIAMDAEAASLRGQLDAPE